MLIADCRRMILCVAASAACAVVSAGAAETGVEQRVAALEQRVAALEARLAVADQKTAQAVEQAKATVQRDDKWLDSVNPFVRHAWVDEAWTRPEPWQSVKQGMTPEEVVKILGQPTRTVESLKPKVDLVYFFEGAIQSNKIRGKVSFRKGVVVAVDQPDFE